jgi:crotonobetainyl-CoA:carnitine CoA-transferase CaiB-like acyl-CoA transferase
MPDRTHQRPVLDLDGLVVLDCSTGIAGAYASKLLGDAGATVTVIEPPGGSPLRRWSWDRELPPGEDGALFGYLRHGQRSVVASEGDPRLRDFVDGADIVVTAGPGPLPAPADLAAGQPGLVVVSITPYGLTGLDAARPATEFTVQADSGALAIRGTVDLPPIQLGGRIVEWVAGAYAGFAALASHRRQAATGDGDLIDISLCEVANLTGSMFYDLIHALSGRPALERPARNVEIPSIEPASDGWVGFATSSRQQFDSFCLLIERPDLIEGGEWASHAARTARADEWNEIVRTWTTRHTTAEIVDRAADLRIPVAPVADGAAVVELDQVKARGTLISDPTGTFLLPRRPWTIDAEPVPVPKPAPAVDAHRSVPAPRHRERPAPSARHDPPLGGVTVVDLTTWWAGPSATALLGALGADVVHVESTRRVDGIRMTGGMFADEPQWWERSNFFLQANTNKYGVTLDLDTKAGRDLALRLIERADVFIENFTPRVIDGFDLGWDVVHATNPRTVMVRMPAFGLDGPWRDRPGFAQTMEQISGLAWLTGHKSDQPRIQRGPCDPNGGVHAAFAVLVGLARRDRTGIGSFIEAPMFEAALNVAPEIVLEWTAYGNRIGRDGNRGPAAAPQGLYACAGSEQWLALAVETDDQWRACCNVIGRSDLAADRRLTSRAGRRREHDRIDEAIGAWALSLDLSAAVAALNSAGVPAAPAADPRTSSRQGQFVARGYFEQVEHPVVGTHPIPGLPWRATGVERWIRKPAPTLGQHNREILGGWLGCDEQQLDALEAEGVIGTRPRGL